MSTPFSPPSGLATGSFNGLHTEQPPFSRPPDFATYFAKGYEGQEGYDRQAGPTQWLFQGPPAVSKVLAAGLFWHCISLALKLLANTIRGYNKLAKLAKASSC